ncbi:1-phosphatidylinositol 4,5-bisphosphate phosphodiesterase beta-2 isoform X2 [Denticeps clupeoides]|uniref:1-phosphatidylinositol 4,5-bisphosphate phosphodiesterase beta-2 isoform X2 n=2 Tax=Denticeps clupeoides TaxID=299321 RepID=UPI0010A2E50D|nr:1-phosphatidylinositol 4,5-bisphosphate phosphodiesterase beta-2 isoform X2 [Denticeps clupeoides]
MIKKRYTLQEPEVKDYLVKGDRFTMWKEDSVRTGPVTMKMDPKGFYLYWTNQSKETHFLDVATIRDTRSGKYAKLPKLTVHPKVRNVLNMDFPDSNHLAKALTVVSGSDMVTLTYHNFFAQKEKVSQNWAADILAIVYNPLRANACRQVFLDKIYVRICLQTNKDGKIPVKNFYKMFPADKKRIDNALSAAGLPKGKFDSIKADVLTEAKFKEFLMHFCPRPEIYEIFTSYSAKAKPIMTKETLVKFLNEKQRDSRLNEELYPPLRIEQVKAIIEKYEPLSANVSRGQISPEGLMQYLMGPQTSVIILDRLAQCQEMTQPLPHYYIKSSHNTYLTAGQFSGPSSPEMYRQCLLSGCRCLELDCWKGKPPDEEPIITHGFTMTTEILFKDVIEAISESAFKTSQYPVILSFENHVDTVKQQEKMANYCRTIFGDALLIDPLEKYPLKAGQQIPSPSELMGKILIKNKKGNSAAPKAKKAQGPEQPQNPAGTTAADLSNSGGANPEGQEGEVQEDHEEQEEHEEQDEEKMKNSDEGTAGQEVTAFEEMSALVNYIQPNKFVSFDNAKKKNKSYVISSFVETKGESLITKTAVEFVEYNKRQMSRIYPKGTRMDSSNYSPQPFWYAGCQMVALNYQTMDFPMQLNMALFEFNGRTGYLLKHDLLRRNDKKFDPYTDRIDTIVANTLSIKIYSGQFLSEKSVKTGVEVEIIGLPGDPKRKYRTKLSATPNAINPVWNEEPFVFEKILLPEMASLRILVYEEGGKFIGHRIIPIDAIQSGFHHICLRSESNVPLTLPALFVYIEVKDYIPAAFADFTDALFNPVKFSDKPSKPSESSTYVSPYELPITTPTEPAGGKASEPPEPPPDPVGPVDGDGDSFEETPATETAVPEVSDLPPGTVNGEADPQPIPEPESAAETPKPAADEQISDDSETTTIPAGSEEIPTTEAPTAPETQDVYESHEEDAKKHMDENSTSAAEPSSTDEQDEVTVTVSEADSNSSDSLTVTTEELIQQKSYQKVIKRQEKDLKEVEKKYQKKNEELTQKYSDLFKALKKKNSLKKKEAGGVPVETGPKSDRVVELKGKMQAELRSQWIEQYQQLRKKKDQHATECLAKLLELANERHSGEIKALLSESKEMKKKADSKRLCSEKGRLQKSMTCDQAEEAAQENKVAEDNGSSAEEMLRKKQAATLEEFNTLVHKMNQDALVENERKMRSLPSDLREAVNACVGVHFPDQVDQSSSSLSEKGGHYGDVFLG